MKKIFLFLFACCYGLTSQSQVNNADSFLSQHMDFFAASVLECKCPKYRVKAYKVNIDPGQLLSRYLQSSVNMAYKVFDTSGHISIDTAFVPQGCKKRLQIFRKKRLVVLHTYPALHFKDHIYRLYNLRHDFTGLEILTVLDSNGKLLSCFQLGYIE